MNLDNFKEYYFLYRNKINMILISFVIIIIFIGGIILINYYNKNTSKETLIVNEPIIKHTVEEKVIENESIYVDIKGSVINEGVYELEKGSRVIDLISLAGGVTDKADPNAYILSCELKDGQNYYIAPRVESTDVCEPVVINKVNINTADKETLMTVQGIGSTIAQAIIDYREQNGQFTFLEQLLEVTGIGNATFEKIKNYICLSWIIY